MKVGKYQQQYDYRCPNSRCGHALVEPYVRPASDVIMWDDIGQRIGDRARPLVPNTMRRIAAGLTKFPYEPSVVTLTHGKDGTDRAFAPHTRPLPTRTAKLGEALLVPVGGSWNDTASPIEEPMRTCTTRESEALVTVDPFIVEFRNNCDAAPIDAPLSTIATARHHGSAVPDGNVGTRPQHAGHPVPQGRAEDRGRAPAHPVDPRLGGHRADRARHRGLLLPHVAAPRAAVSPAVPRDVRGRRHQGRPDPAGLPTPCRSTSRAGSANASSPFSPNSQEERTSLP